MNAAIAIVAIVVILYLQPASADCNSSGSPVLASAADSLLNCQYGPFKLSAGPSTAGGFGASLDGQGRQSWETSGVTVVEDQDRFWLPSFWYLGYALNGVGTTDPGKPNNASASLLLGADSALFHGKFHSSDGTTASEFPALWLGMGAYGDLKYRYGNFEQNGGLAQTDQLLVGGGVYLVPSNLWGTKYMSTDTLPRLSFTYYDPLTNSGNGTLPLPEGVKANYVETEFQATIGFLAKGTWNNDPQQYPFKLGVTYDGSQPTTGTDKGWQSLWKLQLWTTILQIKGVKPVLTYQTGKEGGLTYDKQVLIGGLLEFFDQQSAN